MTKRARFIVVVVALLGVMTGVNAQTVNRSPFGIVEGFWLPERACELGVGWERIIFNWEQHQPTKADDWYTLNVDDRWLKGADVCHREVVALLKHTPAWATEGITGAGVPKGLYAPIDDPENLWANFVRMTVSYYASRGVKHYIIWNEPDIEETSYGFEFSGTLDDYFQLLKVAYLVAKDTDPTTVIHLAGTTYWHDVNEGRKPYLERLFERIAQDPDAVANGFYFDVASLHVYFRVDTIPRLVGEVREAMTRNGINKPIWINETNASPTDDPSWQVVRPQYPLNLDQQAAFLWQAVGLALASDVERVAVYKLYDQQLPAGNESFGIVTPSDASPRPAFYAWKAIITHLTDITDASHAQTNSASVVRLRHAHPRETLILWARTQTATEISVQATGEKAYLIDQEGNLSIITPQEGVYRVALPPAQCNPNDGCFIGGDVRVLVQVSGQSATREGATTLVFP